jgi:hypothetical protein
MALEIFKGGFRRAAVCGADIGVNSQKIDVPIFSAPYRIVEC